MAAGSFGYLKLELEIVTEDIYDAFVAVRADVVSSQTQRPQHPL